MTANVIARSARAASGLTQSELALRSGVAGSSLSLIQHGKREPTVATLNALLRATRHSLVIIPTVRSDAAHIASEIRDALADFDDALVFRRFLQLADNLAAEHGATRVGLTLTEPAPTDSDKWDAAIAALCEFRLTESALPVPDWVALREGDPANSWAPWSSDYDIPAESERVPAAFLRRGILIEYATLESA